MNKKSNRYETSLPPNDDFVLLRGDYELCRNRLMNLQETLQNNPEVLKTYNKIFKEQLCIGIIEQIDTKNMKPGYIHYLPHHPVICFEKRNCKGSCSIAVLTQVLMIVCTKDLNSQR